MNCREAEKQIFAARDGALGNDQRAALASHLETCAACRRVQTDFAVFVDSWRSANDETRTPDSGVEWAKLRRRIAAPEQRRRSPLAWIALPGAALAAAAVAVTVYFKPTSVPPTGAIAPRPAPVAVSTANPAPAVGVPASPAPAPAVVFVDDKSGWTFVWDGDVGQHI